MGSNGIIDQMIISNLKLGLTTGLQKKNILKGLNLLFSSFKFKHKNSKNSHFSTYLQRNGCTGAASAFLVQV
jgi:hypothetical protein